MQVFLAGSQETQDDVSIDSEWETNGKTTDLKNGIYVVKGIQFRKVNFPLVEKTIDDHNRYVTIEVDSGAGYVTAVVDLGTRNNYTRANLATHLTTQFNAVTPAGTWNFQFNTITERFRYVCSGGGVTGFKVHWHKNMSLAWHMGFQQKKHEVSPVVWTYAQYTRTTDTFTARQVVLSIPQLTKETVSHINEQISYDVFQVFYIKSTDTISYIEQPTNVSTYWYIKPVNLTKVTVTFYVIEGRSVRRLRFGGEPWFLEFVVFTPEMAKHNKKVQNQLYN